VSDLLPVLSSTREPFIVFSLPCAVEEDSDGLALVGTWLPTRVNPSQNAVVLWCSLYLNIIEGII